VVRATGAGIDPDLRFKSFRLGCARWVFTESQVPKTSAPPLALLPAGTSEAWTFLQAAIGSPNAEEMRR